MEYSSEPLDEIARNTTSYVAGQAKWKEPRENTGVADECVRERRM
jgi:hypothetical protein